MALIQSYMDFIKVSEYYLVLGENLSAHWNCRMKITRVVLKNSICVVLHSKVIQVLILIYC